MESGRLLVIYNCGKKNIFLNKSNTAVIDIKDTLYTKAVTLNLQYRTGKGDVYETVLLKEFPEILQVSFLPDSGIKIKSIKQHSIVSVFDKSKNHVLAKIYNINESVRKAEISVREKMKNQNGKDSALVNSLKRESDSLRKADIMNAIKVLKKFPSEYYSFWYFRDQILQQSLSRLNGDTLFIKELHSSFEDIFHEHHKNLVEYETIQNLFKNYFKKPITVGDKISMAKLGQHMGKARSELASDYILLDFWASWCRPCIKEIPFLRDVNNKYSSKNLKLISVSIDDDSIAFRKAVNRYEMSWNNILDKEDLLQDFFSVKAVPTLILISSNGEVLYRAEGLDDYRKSELRSILNDGDRKN